MSAARGFFPNWYLALYPDVAASPAFGPTAGAALDHYQRHGVREGRSPSPFFCPEYYRSLYGDLRDAFGMDYRELAKHWLNWGIVEGRRGSPLFDARFYLDSNLDLNAGNTYEQAADHWLANGKSEGRRSTPEVDQPIFSAIDGFQIVVPVPEFALIAVSRGIVGFIIRQAIVIGLNADFNGRPPKRDLDDHGIGPTEIGPPEPANDWVPGQGPSKDTA